MAKTQTQQHGPTEPRTERLHKEIQVSPIIRTRVSARKCFSPWSNCHAQDETTRNREQKELHQPGDSFSHTRVEGTSPPNSLGSKFPESAEKRRRTCMFSLKCDEGHRISSEIHNKYKWIGSLFMNLFLSG